MLALLSERGGVEALMKLPFLLLSLLPSELAQRLLLLQELLLAFFGSFVIGIYDGVVFGVAFSCSIRLTFGRGWGSVIIRSRKKKMTIFAFGIIINVVFGIVIVIVIVIVVVVFGIVIAVVVVVINCEGPTLPIWTLNGSRVLDTTVGTVIVIH